MGWLFFEKPASITGYFRDQINYEDESRKQTLLDLAIVGMTTGYAAIEQILKTTGERKVYAMVILMRFVPKARDGLTFGYKDVDETMGPTEARCPARILDLLTPLPEDEMQTTQWARRWRERCREAISRRRQLTDGAVLYHPQGVSYQNEARHWFHVIKEGRKTTVYCLDGGFPVKFPKWAAEEAELREIPEWSEDLQRALAERWDPERLRLQHGGNYQRIFVFEKTEQGDVPVAIGPYSPLLEWYRKVAFGAAH